MICFFSLLMFTSAFFLFCCFNPVKIGFLLIIFSVSNFFVMFFSLGSSWFPLIFSLLFIGGVIVLLMVISSLFSNEKTDNYSLFFIFLTFLFFIIFFVPFFSRMFVYAQDFKVFLYSGFNFMFMVLLVLGYFFLFLFFISFEKASLRSFC